MQHATSRTPQCLHERLSVVSHDRRQPRGLTLRAVRQTVQQAEQRDVCGSQQPGADGTVANGPVRIKDLQRLEQAVDAPVGRRRETRLKRREDVAGFGESNERFGYVTATSARKTR